MRRRRTIEALNRIPIKIVNGAPVLVQDVAYVRDGNQVQQNIVRANGKRGALLTVLKNGNASTLSVVNTVKSLLPGIRAAAPKDLTITPLFDQSVFVSGAINDVLREGAIAAGLTGLMILMFLGSWRSTLIVLVSIPLSILTSLVVLAVLGETLNIMTLGGLALAVGILVDDATVAIENTYRLMEDGAEFREAVVRGGHRHRQAGTDLHLVDLLRLRLGAVPDRCGEIPVHAAGACGRVRDARLLRAVPDAGAGDDRRAGQDRA